MAGHSQFKNIMYRKGAQDAKRSKMFAKLAKEITVAAKQNPDPSANPRLRAAIIAARDVNMPKDNIDRAIKRSQGNEDGNYEEVRYEGFGPGGVALIVDCLTDNRNRSAADVRAAMTKYGGNMGANGSVAHMFDRVGLVAYPASAGNADRMMEAAIEAGADDVISTEDGHEIYCAIENLQEVREALEKVLGAPESAKLHWRPQNTVTVNEDEARSLMKMLDVLEDHDDVQSVAGNFDIPADVMAKLG